MRVSHLSLYLLSLSLRSGLLHLSPCYVLVWICRQSGYLAMTVHDLATIKLFPPHFYSYLPLKLNSSLQIINALIIFTGRRHILFRLRPKHFTLLCQFFSISPQLLCVCHTHTMSELHPRSHTVQLFFPAILTLIPSASVVESLSSKLLLTACLNGYRSEASLNATSQCSYGTKNTSDVWRLHLYSRLPKWFVHLIVETATLIFCF